MEDHEIELCKNVEPHALVESVKSNAVVRYAVSESPATFNRLQCNTNLNLPPSNWLTSAGSYGLLQSLYQVPGFTSFRLAHMFADCVGDVDVVSDAENIKRLLKLPYSPQGVISMLVHKVGNSLLLDEFDVQKYLLRRSDDEWNWIRAFMLEQLVAYGGESNNFSLKDKSREAVQAKHLLSKFLYYSLKQSLTDTTPALEMQDVRPPRIYTKPVLPEPKVEEKVPDPKSSHEFNRNVLWTFEDIRMLIGTDMPIFGGPNRPCISLRLRDMNKPINVLTGIDYWLDNLMCNVPEVVMCYHLDGLVQKYEIIKTEDLPYLENSQFSPQTVRNMAHNILSFLKANATKEGHTYWLFKARNDDVVKLYDLTTLCPTEPPPAQHSQQSGEEPENPFTVPVAMLLYSVARNMKNTTQHMTPKIAGNIKALLENSIKLLPREKYPQIITSSHYILSDLYVPAGVDPKSPNFDADVDFETDSVYEDDEDSDGCFFDDEPGTHCERISVNPQSIAVGHISDMSKYLGNSGGAGKTRTSTPCPLVAGVEERCRLALEHINDGISCLQFFNTCEDNFIKENEARAKEMEKQRIIHEEQNPNMAKPYKPIALPYETLHDNRAASTQHENSSRDVDARNTTATIDPIKEDEETKAKGKIKLSQNGQESATNLKQQDSVSEKTGLQYKFVTSDFNGHQFGSWTKHLKLLLVEKASLIYAILAEKNYVAARYGACLKAIHMSCRCQELLIKNMPNVVSQKSCLLGRAGDCLFQLFKNWHVIDESIAQYNEQSTTDDNIVSELEKELGDGNDIGYITVPTKNMEKIMNASVECYENALFSAPDTDEYTHQELMRRLGNACNEVGLKYMYWSQDEYQKYQKCDTLIKNNGTDATENTTSKETPLYMELAMKSYDALMRGIGAFTAVDDKRNLAYLYCNMGRYMRFRAHLHSPSEISKGLHKKFYEEAFEYYEKAKSTLGSRKKNVEFWDLFNWELSTATFMLASQLQDAADENQAFNLSLDKDIIDYLQKALKLCDVEHVGQRQVPYIYRSGLIHKRIASYHFRHMVRSCPHDADTANFSKTSLQLCKIHFEKAITIFESLHEMNDLLVTHMERIALQEFLMNCSTPNPQKIKHMEGALEICLSAKSIFKAVVNTFSMADEYSQSDANDSSNEKLADTSMFSEEFYRNMQAFVSQLQTILKNLNKLLFTSKDPKKRVEMYKTMYIEALKCPITAAAEEKFAKLANNKAQQQSSMPKQRKDDVGSDEKKLSSQVLSKTETKIKETHDSLDSTNDAIDDSEYKVGLEKLANNLFILLERFETMIEAQKSLKNAAK